MVRRNIQVLGWTLIWSGVFVFGYLGWQLFATDLLNAGVQAQAQVELEDVFEVARDKPLVVESVDPAEFLGEAAAIPSAPAVPFYPEAAPGEGEELAFLRITKIDLEEVLFEGVDRQTLKSGPGHMVGTALPGQPGNSVLSGHRTTYGRPFFDFDLLEVGDDIEVETTVGTHVYRIRDLQIVQPTDVWVTDDRAGGWLSLTTCNPKFSARERLIVFAEMVSGPNFDFVQLHETKFGNAS